ncbi:alkaline phosphatase [Actinoplanes sp. NPDC051470]|uniref:alkaline phosphatase n=1 Tax=Actinoplanes sp. NPDC051470 TaxID=3157224 RepID=UPI003434A6FB
MAWALTTVHTCRTTVPDYVTDSAASGTGWATGHKTYNGAISVTPDGRPKPTILEKAKTAGFRTGNVTTAELEDATPAMLVSHVVNRDCKGPDAMATCAVTDKVNGGAGSIAEQLVETRADVTVGGGKQYFDQKVKAGTYKDLTVLQQAQVNGYSIVTGLAGLPANPKGPVLGAFAPNNMDLEWVGPKPTRTGTAPSRCALNTARNAAQPHQRHHAARARRLLRPVSHSLPRRFSRLRMWDWS